MHDTITAAKLAVQQIIDDAFAAAQAAGDLPAADRSDYDVEMPADSRNGDFSVNIAFKGAKTLRMAPRAAAELLVRHIRLSDSFNSVSVAGPGFINFVLSPACYGRMVDAVLADGGDFGRTDSGAGKKVMVEFVSANPTGPMHLGNARGGVLGDCIAEALAWSGHEVCREFYVNDAGNQIAKFGKSLEARYLQLYGSDIAFPEDGYQGEDIAALAKQYAKSHGDALVSADSEARCDALVAFALPRNIEQMRAVLSEYRVDYDIWFLESTLHRDGCVAAIVDKLAERGHTYELDGAVWYKATEFGGDKDEVLVKSNGFYTYFAVDIAYHYNKFVTRGFDTVINVWGADHHGHVARLKGAMDAIGIDGNRLEVVLMQMVNLVRDGQPVRMSKRTGKAITLTTLLEEIPVDAARFYFNLREYTSHFDFDLDQAVKQSSDNPVYYVQYAHARICSILKALESEGFKTVGFGAVDGGQLTTDDERALIRQLSMLPVEIAAAGREREPSRITRYAVDLATVFHKFYTNCRVKESDAPLREARTALCAATRQVLRNVLAFLKISAPDAM